MKKLSKNEIVHKKIYNSLDEFKHQLNIWRFEGNRIVFTNGCFDLIHLGHIDYLAKSADLGTKLVVGLNSDLSTSNLKGPNRPVTHQKSRSAILASLFFVDAVILFDNATPINLITGIKPDVLVKGADYNLHEIVGGQVVSENGGEVKTIEFLAGYSTTSIINKIKAS
ncbi:MAG: D-glycero-beta-D-manno-heptose 1-phosphate adenylyltransferase [Flavobacterium sp.]|nr:D-glycero-beta-D-manno-heptose 1-phosphate adenylyltransferase [Pedobacter sp.]